MTTELTHAQVFALIASAQFRPATPAEHQYFLGATLPLEIACTTLPGATEPNVTVLRCPHEVIPGCTRYEVYVPSEEPGEQNCYQITVDVL